MNLTEVPSILNNDILDVIVNLNMYVNMYIYIYIYIYITILSHGN